VKIGSKEFVVRKGNTESSSGAMEVRQKGNKE
jgi:hypothetical protein